MESMTQNDFLGPLFALHPLVVAAIVFLADGGLLILFSWKIKFVKGFFRQPQFVVGGSPDIAPRRLFGNFFLPAYHQSDRFSCFCKLDLFHSANSARFYRTVGV